MEKQQQQEEEQQQPRQQVETLISIPATRVNVESATGTEQHHPPRSTPITLLEMFAPKAARYEPRPSIRVRHEDPIVPTIDDSLEILRMKCRIINTILDEGASFAKILGSALSIQDTSNHLEMAIGYMTEPERQMYDRWVAGIELPTLDPLINRKQSIATKEGSGQLKDRTLALQRMYDNHNMTEENYLWLTVNHSYIIPLVIALTKIIRAERNAKGGRADMTAEDVQELKACNKLLSDIGAVLNTAAQEYRRTTRMIKKGMAGIRARVNAITPNPKKGVTQTRNYNIARQSTGRSVVSKPDYGKVIAGDRLERIDIFAGAGIAPPPRAQVTRMASEGSSVPFKRARTMEMDVDDTGEQ